MNDLDLPPRRTLPPEVRDRIRTRVARTTPPSWAVRHRAPLSVAAAIAAVAVVAAGAVVISQSVAGDFRSGETPPEVSTYQALPRPTVDLIPPNAETTKDLDHCGAAVEASARANEFAPRSAWEPVFTVVQKGVRITAFREYGGKPGFCEIDSGTTARVSDPSAEPMPLAMDGGADIYALYLSPNGLLAGVAQGVAFTEFSVTGIDPSNGADVNANALPASQDELFVVDVGELTQGNKINVNGFDDQGKIVVSGEWTFSPAKVRPIGATGTF